MPYLQKEEMINFYFFFKFNEDATCLKSGDDFEQYPPSLFQKPNFFIFFYFLP